MILNNMFKYVIKMWKLVVGVLRRLIPPFDIFWIKLTASRRNNVIQKYTPISFAEYCQKKAGKLYVIENEQERIVYEPAYYNKSEAREHSFLAHSIYVAELNNLFAHGGTGLVLSGEHVLTDICANDVDGRVKYVAGAIRRANDRAFYVETTEDIDEIECAINLCGLAANNYYHLTVEILSRYEYVRTYLGERKVPVLIDESVSKIPQFKELTETILADCRIIYVPEYKRVLCKTLIQPSMNTWMPMNVRRKNDFRICDNLVAESGISNIRNATSKYMIDKVDKKIFISRKNATLSRIVNEREVCDLFAENGFEVVCTENLSYREQVELFSSARIIVGASGAAMTNLVYCNPGTVFGCIIPRKYGFCIYSSIAHMVGCKMLNLDAKVVKSKRYISTEQCMVDMNECKEYLESLCSLAGDNR